jgi:hypothetical protein
VYLNTVWDGVLDGILEKQIGFWLEIRRKAPLIRIPFIS